jgi:hypothetical protein
MIRCDIAAQDCITGPARATALRGRQAMSGKGAFARRARARLPWIITHRVIPAARPAGLARPGGDVESLWQPAGRQRAAIEMLREGLERQPSGAWMPSGRARSSTEWSPDAFRKGSIVNRVEPGCLSEGLDRQPSGAWMPSGRARSSTEWSPGAFREGISATELRPNAFRAGFSVNRVEAECLPGRVFGQPS